MLARSLGPALALALVASLPPPASAQANGTGIREVSATGRSLITLQTRVRYTTMVLLPDGEEILDVICGDRDFWVITATHNIAHVKPAKEGAATNMNLVTASGAVYSFLLTEKGGTGIVVGGVVVGPRASELIHPVSIAVAESLTADQLAQAFTVYPSMSGSIAEAARRLHRV